MVTRRGGVIDASGKAQAVNTVTDLAARDRAALDILNRLPEWWRVGPATYDPGTRRWRITAFSRPGGRLRPPETLTGVGEDELHAMTELRILLDERQRSEQLEAIERRGRAAFLEGGAEAQSQAAEGRPLRADELERVTRRYPK
jgi:hypothetical protein